jgi:hypothetical protein
MKLEPCPFCKCIPSLVKTYLLWIFIKRWHVECSNKYCIVAPKATVKQYTEENAIEAWNYRSTEPIKIKYEK